MSESLLHKNIDELIDLVDGKKKLDKDKVNTTNTEELYKLYDKAQEFRRNSPDVILLIEVVIIICILTILYILWPYLTADKSLLFSKEQFDNAMKLNSNSFNINDVTKVNMELKAMDEYFKYFTDIRTPYSLKSQGIIDLMKGTIFMPFVMVGTFIVAPIFISTYILWFIWKYWKITMEACFGFLDICIYRYLKATIEGKLGCFFFIKIALGYHCHGATFDEFYSIWYRQYVEEPLYHEKLKYIDNYHMEKDKHITLPKLKYIDNPIDTVKTHGEYIKETVVDRSIESFMKAIKTVIYYLFDNPKLSLYKLVYNKTYIIIIILIITLLIGGFIIYKLL